MKFNLKLIAFIGITLALAWLMGTRKLLFPMDPYPSATPQPNPPAQLFPLQISDVHLQAEIKRTPAEQELGLSWRPSLDPNQAVVFVYSQPQRVLYWMKGMQFPLDFIWVKQGKIVEVSENIPAPTKENPVVRTIAPQSEVDTVIEVNAGFIKQHNIKVGDEVKLNK